jgi:hypothetical protein
VAVENADLVMVLDAVGLATAQEELFTVDALRALGLAYAKDAMARASLRTPYSIGYKSSHEDFEHNS